MKKKIDVVGQMILGAIPAFIPQLYAFYRIKKFKKGLLVQLLVVGLILLEYGFDEGINYGMDQILNPNHTPSNDQSYRWVEDAMGIVFESLFPLYFVRKWTLEYNEKIDTPQDISDNS